MLAEVISQIAAFFKNWTTVRMATLKIKFDPHRFGVSYLDSLMPRSRNTLEGLGLLPGGAPQFCYLTAFSQLMDEAACFLLWAKHALLSATLTN
jgi:hypothetical protein